MMRFIMCAVIVSSATAYAFAADAAKSDGPAAAAAVTPDVTPPAAKNGIRLAVADIDEVYMHYKRREDKSAELRTWAQQTDDQISGLQKELDQLRTKLKSLAMGTPQYLEAKTRSEDVEKQLRQLQYDSTKKLDEKTAQLTSELYQDIVEVIAAYAKANDIDLVIKQQMFRPADDMLPEVVKLEIQKQAILYQSPRVLDITEAVTKQLNEKYAAEKAKDGAGAK